MDTTTDSMEDDDCNEWQVISVQQGQAKTTKKQAPATDFTWDDGAILSCFQMATVTSHSSPPQQGDLQQEWKAPSTETNVSRSPELRPQPLSLPSWAVDPLVSLPSDNESKWENKRQGKEWEGYNTSGCHFAIVFSTRISPTLRRQGVFVVKPRDIIYEPVLEATTISVSWSRVPSRAYKARGDEWLFTVALLVVCKRIQPAVPDQERQGDANFCYSACTVWPLSERWQVPVAVVCTCNLDENARIDVARIPLLSKPLSCIPPRAMRFRHQVARVSAVSDYYDRFPNKDHLRSLKANYHCQGLGIHGRIRNVFVFLNERNELSWLLSIYYFPVNRPLRVGAWIAIWCWMVYSN